MNRSNKKECLVCESAAYALGLCNACYRNQRYMEAHVRTVGWYDDYRQKHQRRESRIAYYDSTHGGRKTTKRHLRRVA